MTQNNPLQTDILEMFGTDLSSVCTINIVGRILSGNAIGESIAGVQCQNGRDMQSHGRNDDIYVKGVVPTLLGLYLIWLMVFLTKSTASEAVLLDFQLPAINRLFRENSCLNREVLNISN